jgi:hypothetical protein
MFEAACEGDIPRVLKYLDKGMDVNRLDKVPPPLPLSSSRLRPQGGNTLLHWASEYGHTVLVSLLLHKGADAHILDKHKSSPLDVARQSYRFYHIAPPPEGELLPLDTDTTMELFLVPLPPHL